MLYDNSFEMSSLLMVVLPQMLDQFKNESLPDQMILPLLPMDYLTIYSKLLHLNRNLSKIEFLGLVVAMSAA